MKYNSIGEQLIAKAKEIDPSYQSDKFNDMSEALNIILNNITNTHRTELFILGTLSQLTGTLSNASEIGNAFNDGYTPIIKFNYNGTTYYFAEPSGTYDSSSNTGSLSWTNILSDKTIEKFVLNFPDGNYTLSNEEDNTVIIDLGELSTSGTLSSQILTQINNNLESKSITFTVTIDGYSITTSNYLKTGNVLLLSILASSIVYEVVINFPDGTYYNNAIELLDSENIKTINSISLVGSGNIAVQEPLVSGTNIKTINGQSLLGSGNLPITADITYATDNEVNNLFTNPGQPIPERAITLANLNAFKQQIENEINNQIGNVLQEGF